MMKTVTIFSEKGGVGKTTLTVLLASYLAYVRRERVCALDFDHPSYQLTKMREVDETILRNNTANQYLLRSLPKDVAPYPINRVEGRGAFTREQLAAIVSQVRKRREQGDGWMLLDFPGRFLPGDPSYALALAGLLDLVVLPIDSDRQSISSALYLNSILHSDAFKKASGKPGGQEALFLWNREAAAERRSGYDRYAADEEALRLVGVPVSKHRVRDIVIARRDANTFGFIRSTLCFPTTTVMHTAPYLIPLFEEIIQRAEGTWKDEQ